MLRREGCLFCPAGLAKLLEAVSPKTLTADAREARRASRSPCFIPRLTFLGRPIPLQNPKDLLSCHGNVMGIKLLPHLPPNVKKLTRRQGWHCAPLYQFCAIAARTRSALRMATETATTSDHIRIHQDASGVDEQEEEERHQAAEPDDEAKPDSWIGRRCSRTS